MMSGENGRRVTIGLLQYVQFFLNFPSVTTLFTLDTSSASSKHYYAHALSHSPSIVSVDAWSPCTCPETCTLEGGLR